MVLVPVTQAGVQDKRGRFREIYCAVLEARAGEVPDHRPCDEALTHLDSEPAASGQPVPLGASNRRLVAAVIPGIGYDCIAQWLQPPGTMDEHVRKYGYEQRVISVDCPVRHQQQRAPDSRRGDGDGPRVRSAAPGVGRLFEGHARRARGDRRLSGDPPACGSRDQHCRGGGRFAARQRCRAVPGRSDAPLPGSTCDSGDGGGVASLRTDVRRTWLARNPLPRERADLLGRDLAAARAHFVDPAQERGEARA